MPPYAHKAVVQYLNTGQVDVLILQARGFAKEADPMVDLVPSMLDKTMIHRIIKRSIDGFQYPII